MHTSPIRDDDLERLYTQYVTQLWPWLLRYVSSICRNHSDAEEICQDTFHRLHAEFLTRTFDENTPLENIRNWLRCVARRRCIDRFRRIKRQAEMGELPDELVDPSLSPEDEVFRREVQAAIDDLPPKNRECVWLWLYGLTLREIGECLDLDARRVHERLKHASGLLRSDLNG